MGLTISVQVHNPASVPLTGTLQIQALNKIGQVVADFNLPVDNLPAGESELITQIWDTAGLPNGDYKILANLSYESGSSQPLETWVSSYRKVYLPLVIR
jgi:hypothetical protein